MKTRQSESLRTSRTRSASRSARPFQGALDHSPRQLPAARAAERYRRRLGPPAREELDQTADSIVPVQSFRSAEIPDMVRFGRTPGTDDRNPGSHSLMKVRGAQHWKVCPGEAHL